MHGPLTSMIGCNTRVVLGLYSVKFNFSCTTEGKISATRYIDLGLYKGPVEGGHEDMMEFNYIYKLNSKMSKRKRPSSAEDLGYIYFFSKSKDPDYKYLSNFQITPEPLLFMGAPFRSIEHAFQAAKFLSLKGRKPAETISLFLKFSTRGPYGGLDPAKVKSLGGKGSFKKEKVELDIKEWNRSAPLVMKELVVARCQVDPKYRHLLKNAAQKGIRFFHFERKGGLWGGNFPAGQTDVKSFRGENLLGYIMDHVAHSL